jgi:WS/DGAT/MGAT family acyltransferase
MIDGISGVDIMNVLMDTEPREHEVEPLPWQPRPEPSRFDLLLGAVEQRMSLPREIMAGYARRRGELVERATALASTILSGFQSIAATPLNGVIGPHRRFAQVSFALDDVKRVKRSLGGSLNDVVLAVVTGGVRRLFESRRFSVGDVQFRVMAPVSTRSSEQRGSLGNRVSSWFVDLPIDERDPARALARISSTTARLKDTKQALGAEVLTRVSEWTGGTLLNLGTQLAKNTLTFNTVVTNVPGPQVPLYLLGARMEEAYPVVPLFVNQGVGIALFSYAGRLFWGINADWDIMPDVEQLAQYLGDAFRELLAVAEQVSPIKRHEPRQTSAPRRGSVDDRAS